MTTIAEAQRGLKKLQENALKEIKDKGDQGIKDKGLRDKGIKVYFSSYEDTMDFVNRHPQCVYGITNWGLWPPALTTAVKESSPEIVLQAIAATKAYKAARVPAKFFWHKWKEFSQKHNTNSAFN